MMVLKLLYLANLDPTKMQKDRQVVNHVKREHFVELVVYPKERVVHKAIIVLK
jgi:hypothetical protein